MTWQILTAISVAGLAIFWRGPNAVWGGATIGLLFGLIAGGIYSFTGNGFHWSTVGKWIVICAPIGFVIELAARLFKKNSDSN